MMAMLDWRCNMKRLIIILAILLIPTLSMANYFTTQECQPKHCNDYPQFKVVWYGPDGIHTWDRVCNFQTHENGAYSSFCVDGKIFAIPGIPAIEEVKK
jgi:hypothetical protein